VTWLVYSMPKPDGLFHWMRAFDELRKELDAAGDSFWREVVDREYEVAMESAKASGWSGDFRDAPRVFVLPDADTMRYGFVWTQPDDELTTFVVSPLPLPWLE
jgi:hypothetical protein